MKKNFIEVMRDIKDGETYLCTSNKFTIRSITNCGGTFLIEQGMVSGMLTINQDARFVLKKNKHDFTKAFDAYNNGYEIESVVTGNKYVILNGFEFVEINGEHGRQQSHICSRFRSDELRGEWYINETI